MLRMSFDHEFRAGWSPLVLGMAVACLSACVDSNETASEGQVELVQESVGTPAAEGKATAWFDHSERIRSCSAIVTDQACSLFPCPPPAPAADEPSLPAGTVSISAMRGFLGLSQGPDRRYADVDYSGTVPLWGMELEDKPELRKITVEIAGSYRGAPPFAYVLEGPLPIVLTDPPTPAPPEGHTALLPAIPITVVRSEGLSLTWEGGSTGFVEVVSTVNAQQPNRLVCRWPVEELSQTISPNMLAGLSAGAAELMVSVGVAAPEYADGVWRLQVSARKWVARLSATLE
jgi:hypothetical protein